MPNVKVAAAMEAARKIRITNPQMVDLTVGILRYGRRSEVQPPPATLSYDAAALLVEFDGLEQRLEIPLAESLVALALDDFEEYRPDGVLGEDLQQDPARRIAVDQDAAACTRRFTAS
jgi:hypothetical protein